MALFKTAVKTALFAAVSAVAVPYFMALLANVFYGWPLRRDRYSRALNPHKVYALSYALLLEFCKLRYANLALQWRYFYAFATPDRVAKNIPYGRNEKYLDVYTPRRSSMKSVGGGDKGRSHVIWRGSGDIAPNAVLVFIYGGTWGSGDKSMYGLLCSHLADSLNVVVVCPNYSTYPEGFVDDMVQDVSDAIQWVHQHIHQFNGDKDRIALVGHSAGAHLAALTVLELSLRRLIDPTAPTASPFSSLPPPASSTTSLSVSIASLGSRRVPGTAPPVFIKHSRLDESRSQTKPCEDTPRSESPHGLRPDKESSVTQLVSSGEPVQSSFYIISDAGDGDKRSGGGAETNMGVCSVSDEYNGAGLVESTTTRDASESFYVVSDTSSVNASDTPPLLSLTEVVPDPPVLPSLPPENKTSESISSRTEGAKGEGEEMSQELGWKWQKGGKEEREGLKEGGEDKNSDDILKSVRLVIGLAGVYDIAAHYVHEEKRGVEDVSTMARAMYGLQQFNKFSPTIIVRTLPTNIRLPEIVLLHGDSDFVVPLSSSIEFGEALCRRGFRSVRAVILPSCGHFDVCLDLMDERRLWHDVVLDQIATAVNRCLL